jgi:hypothetical protein
VWESLCPLIYGAPAWDYVKACDKKQDEHMAFRILQHHGEGDAMRDVCHHKVEETIKKAHYDEQSRCFMLYVVLY